MHSAQKTSRASSLFVDEYSTPRNGATSREVAVFDHVMTSSAIQEYCGDDLVPSADDVICGKGKSITNHTGNRSLSAIIGSCREVYQESPKTKKSRICSDIVKMVKARGGRFLRLDSSVGKYYEAKDEFAREKVGHALRSHHSGSTSRRSTKKTFDPNAAVKKCEDLYRTQQRIFREMLEKEITKCRDTQSQG